MDSVFQDGLSRQRVIWWLGCQPELCKKWYPTSMRLETSSAQNFATCTLRIWSMYHKQWHLIKATNLLYYALLCGRIWQLKPSKNGVTSRQRCTQQLVCWYERKSRNLHFPRRVLWSSLHVKWIAAQRPRVTSWHILALNKPVTLCHLWVRLLETPQ